ncbi:hypothetical protein PIB30_010468 [Stylosanthes scabra]|uniref:Uncharacterized protein n=1 Tax=Stylosanthes scabra TaxID=79078 RepID=A0ABU6Z355_9FABA|nr:hypothetical protein [Stylosanthes scabra]
MPVVVPSVLKTAAKPFARTCIDGDAATSALSTRLGPQKECSLDTKFLANCTNNNVPYLQDNDLPLLSISLDQGEIRVSLPVASDCYYTNSSSKKGHFFNNETDQFMFFENYSISTSRNVFTTVGCQTLGLVVGRSYYSYEDDEFISTQAFPKACLSYCEKSSEVNAKDGECEGTGCCNTTVPEDSQGHGLSMMSYFFENSVLNNSQVIDYNPCGHAFLVENGTYTFETAHLHKLENTSFPVVLDWTVGENQICEGAKKNHSTYACKAQYSTCVDSKKLPGYLCKCLPGFQGNPYLHHGCKDIDECKEANKFCVEEATSCKNFIGSYSCVCPEGYTGNGKIHKTGNETHGCTRRPAPSEINIVNTKTPKQHNRQKTALLFVSVSILALFLVIFNVYCGLKKRELNKIKQQFFQQNGGLLLQQKIAKQKGSIETAKIFSIEELKKATNNFDEGKILGRGGYGIVYKGILQDNTTVAIKKSKISDQSQIEQFINEVIILSQINHTNVVKLLGCCLETQVPLLVYEFIQGGTLYDHLHGHNQSLKLNWKTRLRIASETAGALAYLHSATCPSVIHRDVKTTNILLDHNLKAKVSDFGASKIVPLDQTQFTTLVQGTIGYLDPEYFHTSHLTEKSDVYSFGVVLAELLTGRKALCFDLPENDRNLAMYFISSVNKGLLLQILDNQITNGTKPEQVMEFANIAKRCLRLKGEERPTMKEVATELEGLRIMENHRWETERSSLEETKNLVNPPSSSSLSSAFYGEDGVYGRDIISRLESIGQITISLGGR